MATTVRHNRPTPLGLLQRLARRWRLVRRLRRAAISPTCFFLKMDDEQVQAQGRKSRIPLEVQLAEPHRRLDGSALEEHIARRVSKHWDQGQGLDPQPSFARPRARIQDPAKLCRLVDPHRGPRSGPTSTWTSRPKSTKDYWRKTPRTSNPVRVNTSRPGR